MDLDASAMLRKANPLSGYDWINITREERKGLEMIISDESCACKYVSMLEPLADEIREWENAVTQFMIEYFGELRDRPVYRQTSSREIRSGLDSKLPIKGTDFDSLLKVFRDTIVPFSRQNAHPRMFGYVQSPGTPIGAFADLLASTLNANLTIWRSAPRQWNLSA